MLLALGIAACLTWLGTAYQLHSLLKRRSSATVRSYWFVLLFVSLGLTFLFPPVYRAIGEFSGVANLGRLLSNVAAVLAVLGTQNITYSTLVSEPRSSRLRRSAFAATAGVLLAMGVLFFYATPLEERWDFWRYYGLGPITAYRLTYLAYMGASAGVLAGLWARYALMSTGLRLKAGFGLMAAGGTMGVAYVANDVGLVAAAFGWRPFSWWGNAGLNDVFISLAITLVFLGAMTPVWLRIADSFRAHLAFLRLRSLWVELSGVCPQVILLPRRPLWLDALDVRDATFRLRRVTEIRDGLLSLSSFADPDVQVAATRAATSLGEDPAQSVALAEAAVVCSALQTFRRGTRAKGVRPESGPGPVRYVNPEDGGFWSEVRHLILVARHMRGSPLMQRVLSTLAPPGKEQRGAKTEGSAG